MTFFIGNDLRPSTGIVQSKVGKRILNFLDLNDLPNQRRHIDQVRFNCNQIDFENTNESVISEAISDPILFNNNNVVSENNLSRSERIRNMPVKNCKHLQFNSTCRDEILITDSCDYSLYCLNALTTVHIRIV